MTTTTKHHVCLITPAAAGFGQYERGERAPTDYDDAIEHAIAVVSENQHLMECLVGGGDNETAGDLAEAINAAHGAVLGGHGTLIAYRDRSGEIILESFDD